MQYRSRHARPRFALSDTQHLIRSTGPRDFVRARGNILRVGKIRAYDFEGTISGADWIVV